MKLYIIYFLAIFSTISVLANKSKACHIRFSLGEFNSNRSKSVIEIIKYQPDSLQREVLWKKYQPKSNLVSDIFNIVYPQEVFATLIINDTVVGVTPHFYLSNEEIYIEFKDRSKAATIVKSYQNDFVNENRALYLELPAKIVNYTGFSYKKIRQYYDVFIPDNRLLDFYLKEYENTVVRQIELNKRMYYSLVKFENSKDQFSLKTLDTCYAILQKSFKGSPLLKKLADYISQSKKIQIGKKLLSFKVEDSFGNTIVSDSFVTKKEYSLIDFWASWCSPCRKDMQTLKKMYSNFDTSRFQIISISIDDDKSKWQKAISTDGIDWVNYIDKGGWQSNVAKTFNITFIPKNFIIDKSGKIIDFDIRDEKLKVFLKDKDLLK